MPWFRRQPAPIGVPAAAGRVIGNMFDPAAVLGLQGVRVVGSFELP
jgi:hypothetical protein